MNIVDETSVTQFELVRLCHQPTAAGLVTMADIRLRNAAGTIIGRDSIPVTWTAQELASPEAKVAEEITQYAATTGWTEYAPPKEKEK